MRSSKEVIIYGAGGHSKVIIDILELMGRTIAFILDDDITKKNRVFMGYEIKGGIERVDEYMDDFEFIVGVGENNAREAIVDKLSKNHANFTTAVHPSAIIAGDVRIGRGTVIMANTVLNPGTVIGTHCIINTSVSIDHENIIEDFVHISPGVVTGGQVRIARKAWLGLGAKIVNNISIGKSSVIGAGAVVLNDVPGNVLVAGIPAEIKRRY